MEIGKFMFRHCNLPAIATSASMVCSWSWTLTEVAQGVEDCGKDGLACGYQGFGHVSGAGGDSAASKGGMARVDARLVAKSSVADYEAGADTHTHMCT